MKLVIVESPTKARTIRKFLGSQYHVESCMGHIRDLPQSAKDIPEEYKKENWSRLGVNVEKGFEPIYCIPKIKTKVVRELKALLKEADELILATDEDREGESISWHLVEVLKPKISIKRMVFHEITKTAIKKALDDSRDIDMDLVRAQEARRILDRLVGYTLSPLLWKKVAYGLSAGRVQSVAVKLICERELQRLKFKKAKYWGLLAKNQKDKKSFESRLWSYQEKRVATGKDFDPNSGQLIADKKSKLLWVDQPLAEKIQKEILSSTWKVQSVEEKPVSRKPAPPFITSTLQQEANRKLGLGAKEAMQVAQKLYEQGHITYMRTDSNTLSTQAIQAIRSRIKKLYGDKYLTKQPRTYEGKKAKGAQEAHEAIRPSGTEMIPPEETKLRGVQLNLYELIWKRTIASQLPNAQLKQVNIRLKVAEAVFAASGQSVEFPGFLKVYVEGSDEPADEDQQNRLLPKMASGDLLDCLGVDTTEHETKAQARYTEASLVQVMEKEGIGRPSTYAPTISTIIDRGYVNRVGHTLVPSLTAMIVSRLLSMHLPSYVDLGFTTEMENHLDEIAGGELDSQSFLKSVYFGKKGLLQQVEQREKSINPDQARQIQFDCLPDLSFRVGRYGAYVCRVEGGKEQCASLPHLQAPADITVDACNKLIEQKLKGADALGKDPDTGEPIYILAGPYGSYAQRGDATDKSSKPKRTSLPQGVEPEGITLKQALFLLSLPLCLGDHPESKKEVKVGIGRFGPYVVCDGDFRSIPKDQSLFEMDFKKAMDLLSKPKSGRGRRNLSPVKELGKHPKTQEDMNVFDGRYGPYIKMGKINVSLPDDLLVEDVTSQRAVLLLESKLTATAKKGVKKKKTTWKKKKTKKKGSFKKLSQPEVTKAPTKKKVILRKRPTG